MVYTAYGAWLLFSVRRHRSRSVQVPGVVTGLVRSRDPDSYTSRPIFRFTTVEGHEVEVTSRHGEASPPQPGDSVTILYDRREPRRAVIDTSGQRGSTLGWLLTALGLFLLTMSVLTALDIL
ncbi:DUF3592 domain-containing protein [Nocardia fusca]|uniref:DUF3592 domain-containing protein n=1 Tax=Nocardia fusca TaxID=941183 RepID=A0ABV3F5X1_9NOCA